MSGTGVIIDGDGIRIRGKVYPIQHTALTPSANGTVALAAAVSGHKHRVISFHVYLDETAATTCSLASAATLKLTMGKRVAGGSDFAPFNPMGWCETASGEALNLISTTNIHSITVAYITYPA